MNWLQFQEKIGDEPLAAYVRDIKPLYQFFVTLVFKILSAHCVLKVLKIWR